MKYYQINNKYLDCGCDDGYCFVRCRDILAFLREADQDLIEIMPTSAVECFWLDDVNVRVYKTRTARRKNAGKILDNLECLIKRGADVHAGGEHALRWAVEAGLCDVVRRLIDLGADFNVNDNDLIVTAAIRNDWRMVKTLIYSGGAFVRADNDVVLQWAIVRREIDVCRFLIDNGASITAALDDQLLSLIHI